MNTGRYARERDVAIEAAFRAAGIIKHYAGRLSVRDVQEKATHDLVTHVDEDAQEAIIDELRTSFPDHAIVAEEGASHQPELAGAGFRWIIDPIDGTTNFLHGVPPYAVSIALQHDGELVVGVVLDVSRDELFTAVRGGGFSVNGRRHRVSSTKRLGDSLVTTGFPYRAFERMEGYLEAMKSIMRTCRGLRRPGSASVDLAYVAAGRFDAFFETDLRPWDVAAGMLLVEEAGGRTSDLSGGPNPVSGVEILATNGHIHDAILEVLAPLRDDAG